VVSIRIPARAAIQGTAHPHSGHSSQFSFDHNHRSAQFLPTVARNALNVPVTPESRALAGKRLRMQHVTVTAHSGHSSQLVLTPTAEMRTESSLSCGDYGMSISKTGRRSSGSKIRVVREDGLRSFLLSKQTENEFDGDAHAPS